MNNLNLPVPADHAVFQPVYVDLNNPPYVPNYACDPKAQEYLGMASSMCCYEIQQQMNRNPLRMFTYNLMSQRNYANEPFGLLVTGVIDWMTMEMYRNRYRNPEDALADLVPKMVEMVTCAQIRNFTDLDSLIDDNTHNKAAQLIDMLDNTGREVQQFRQQQQGNGWGQQQQPSARRDTGWAQQRSGRSSSGDWNVNPYGGGGVDGRQGTSRVQSHSNQSVDQVFRGGQNRVTGEQMDGQTAADQRFRRRNHRSTTIGGSTESSTPSSMVSRPGGNRRPIPAETIDDVVNQATQPSSHAEKPAGRRVIPDDPVKVETKLADDSGWTWYPHDAQPWPLAYSPSTHLLYHQRTGQGPVTELLKERVEGTMDYDKHRLSRAFGPSPRRVDPKLNASKLEQMHKTLVVSRADTELDGAAKELLKNRLMSDVWIMENTQEACWIVGMIGRMVEMNEGKQSDIYHRRAKLAQPVVGMVNEDNLILELSLEKSFAGLRLKLLSMGERMSPELWYLCERKMTDAINRVLRQRMSITNITISSFVEDIGELDAVIRQQYSGMFADIFMDSQETLIKTTFSVFGPEAKEEEDLMNENFLSNYQFEGEQPKFTYLVSNVTMTFLSIMAHELDLEVSAKRATLVTDTVPFVKELVRDIIKNVAVPDDFDRHFIRTIDGRILELTLGLVGTDSYLLTLVR